jgi:hypothetical protein
MSTLRSAAMTLILSGIAAILALPPLLHGSRASLASLVLGTDDAFAISGLEPRENQVGGGAIRWMRPKASFRFASVGPGPVDIDLELRDHRTEVTIIANGARIGSLSPGQGHLGARVLLSGSDLVLGIETDGFEATSRRLGTRIVSIGVQPEAAPPGPGGVPPRIWLAMGAVLLVASLGNWLSGLSPWSVPLPALFFLAMVLPAGLWRSGWLADCAVMVALSAALSALASRFARGSTAARGFFQVAILVALTVHGVLPPSPLVIQGDAQLHGNKLAEVAAGNRFPTSRTDHKHPFEFPYGFSFYGALSPFVSPEVSSVRIVREGAAFFWALSILGLGLVLGRLSASLGAASVILWTFAPVNIRTMGFGNLSNVFAQAIFVLFLAGAAMSRKGKLNGAVLAFLVALSATAHLSSFIVLATLLLVALLFRQDRRSPAFKPLSLGLVVAAGYYATFLPMVAAQLPRILGERGGSGGVFDPWRLPSQIFSGAGWPLLSLIALSLLVAGPRLTIPLARSVIAASLLLALLALVSPVEVRYLLAALPVLATLGASVLDRSDTLSFPRQNLSSIVDLRWLRMLGSEAVSMPLAAVLIIAACVHGAFTLLEFVPLSRV